MPLHPFPHRCLAECTDLDQGRHHNMPHTLDPHDSTVSTARGGGGERTTNDAYVAPYSHVLTLLVSQLMRSGRWITSGSLFQYTDSRTSSQAIDVETAVAEVAAVSSPSPGEGSLSELCSVKDANTKSRMKFNDHIVVSCLSTGCPK